MSLEVAEHLDEAAADTFVASLVALAPLVLFSAAIPYQGGTNHVNEQWPSYWHAKFAARDYVVVDCLRERLWRNEQVTYWYAQNMLFFVRRDRLADYPALAAHVARAGDGPPLHLVHPGHYLGLYDFQEQRIETLGQELERAHGAVLRTSLLLREVNFAVFPDWKLDYQVLLAQFRELCAALLAHPAGGRMTLVVHLPNTAAHELLRRAAVEARSLVPSSPAGVPNFSGVDDAFSAYQWKLVTGQIQARIVLSANNEALVAASGATALPRVTVASLNEQSFA